jgi:hypothetical protein
VGDKFTWGDVLQVGRSLQMEDGFVRVDNAGTGFLMIRRDVLETMAEFYRSVLLATIDSHHSEVFSPVDSRTAWLQNDCGLLPTCAHHTARICVSSASYLS